MVHKYTLKEEKTNKFFKGWAKEVNEAQKYPSLVTKSGKLVKRIKYGQEKEDWGAKSGRRCHDCGVKAGSYHAFGCDVERTPKGGQLLVSDRYISFSKGKKKVK